MEIFEEFSFEASHRLPNVPDGHKCKQLHGHSYRVVVHLEGPVDPHVGWVVDFWDVGKICKPVIEKLDHRCLNDVEGLENPTSEYIARWIWDHVKPSMPLLNKVVVKESATSGCIYRGEG
ncbi:MAG: 6-carboxytetrahydropterin synthase QueD [bacterium]